jgi:hypothetical protein
LAVSEESHDASQEATRRGDGSNYQKVLLFLSTISDQALFHFLICAYFWFSCHGNLEEAVEHLTMASC